MLNSLQNVILIIIFYSLLTSELLERDIQYIMNTELTGGTMLLTGDGENYYSAL